MSLMCECQAFQLCSGRMKFADGINLLLLYAKETTLGIQHFEIGKTAHSIPLTRERNAISADTAEFHS